VQIAGGLHARKDALREGRHHKALWLRCVGRLSNGWPRKQASTHRPNSAVLISLKLVPRTATRTVV
jgi:hypothetical protein